VKLLPRLRRVFRMGAFKSDPDQDLEEELGFHFAQTEEELLDRGLSPAEAREEALRRFGDLDRYRTDLSRAGRRNAVKVRWRARFETASGDLGGVLRGLGRSPGFSTAVVLTMALGIGANATMFGVVDHLLLSPPAHVVDAGQVVRIQVSRVSPFTGEPGIMGTMTWTDYQAYEEAGGFQSVAAFGDDPLVLGRGGDAVRVRGLYVTGSFFSLLGVKPALGRFFGEEEAAPGAPQVVVLGYGLWQRRFGGDPAVVGRSLPIGETVYSVIGVAPEGFNGVQLDPVDLYLPIHAYTTQTGSDRWITHRGYYWLQALGRLAPGVSRDAVGQEATALHLNSRQDYIDEGRYPADARVVLGSVKAALAPNAPAEVRVARWLLGVVLVVLLIACANVANLLLARGIRRSRELGIRVALGISRKRLVGQLLLESLVLAALGGLVGLALAYGGGHLMRVVFLPDVAWRGSPVNLRVLVFALAVAGGAGLLAGTAPALKGAGRGVLGALKDGGWGGTGRRSRSQSVLLVAQTALSVILLVGAGLFVQSLHHVRGLDLGMDPQGLVLVEPDLEGEWDGPALLDLAERARARIAALPGVASASFSDVIPFWSMSAFDFFVPGMDSIPSPKGFGPFVTVASPQHLSTLGIRTREGRMFTPEDATTGARVVVLSANMARGLWPQESALGKCVVLSDRDGPCWEVIGVVEPSKLSDVTEEEPWQYYIPFGEPALELEATPSALFVRVRGDPGRLLAPIRREVQGLDSRIRFVYARPLQELIDPGIRSWVLGASMFSLFGGLALVVAMLGLYSVLAFNVARRTRELGVRSALGANQGRLLGMIMRQALAVTGLGVTVGLALAVAASSAMGPLLFDTSPRDPRIFAVVGAVLLLVAVAAGAVPALAASRVDPMGALRAD